MGESQSLSRRQLLQAAGAATIAVPLSSLLSSRSFATSAPEPVTLSLGHFLGTQFEDQFLPQMATILPNITIEEQPSPYDSYHDKVTTQLAAGTAPDIFMWDVGTAGAPFTTSIGSPWNDFMANKGDNGLATTWATPFQMATDDPTQIIGLPVFFPQSHCVHINEELADKAGLLADAPLWGTDIFDTWDWDTFVEWAKAGTKMTSSGDVEQYGVSVEDSVGGTIFQSLVTSNGGTLFSGGEPLTYTNNVSNLTSPEVVDALQKLTDLIIKHKVAPAPDVSNPGFGGTYREGNAMSVIFLANSNSFAESDTFPQKYMAMPYTQHKVRQVGIAPYIINNQSDNQDAAREWVYTWLTNPDSQLLQATINGTPAFHPLPIIESLPDGQNRTTCLVNLSRVPGQTTVPGNDVGVVDSPYFMDCPDTAFARNTIQSAIDAAFLGSSTPAEALADAHDAISAKISG